MNHEPIAEIVEQKSRFLGYAFEITDPLDFRPLKQKIRENNKAASHVVYAFVCGGSFSCSDDREPPHTAGSQILSEIQRSGQNNLAVVVVRYFGGKKLGKKNLALAYRECARITIEKYLGMAK